MARPKHLDALEQRLRKRLQVAANGCWEWTGYRNTARGGYGQIGLGEGRKVVMTHRAAWMVWRGPIPPGMSVLHRCDNPACCNPAHLFLGSRADNVADMVAKGRMAVGERLPQSKLTAKQVRAIRIDPRPQKEIAISYGVAQSQVSRIRSGEEWKHV